MAKKKQKHKKSKNGKGGMAAAATAGTGLFGGLAGLLPSRRSEQFLLGAAIGVGLAYVMSDEQLRGRIIKSGLKLYSGLVGGVEEFKEQVADARAELEAEQSGAA